MSPALPLTLSLPSWLDQGPQELGGAVLTYLLAEPPWQWAGTLHS